MTGDAISSALRDELRRLSERYARAADRRDVEGFVAVFAPDGTLQVGGGADGREVRTMRGHADLAGVPGRLERYDTTSHVLGPSTYRRDGSWVRGEVGCVAHHVSRADDGATDRVLHIRYDDVYAGEGAGTWRILERRVVVEQVETRAVD